jgi:hypothetical protein
VTKTHDHQVFDLQMPESILVEARKMAMYTGLSLEEFILSAIRDKLIEDENAGENPPSPDLTAPSHSKDAPDNQ